MNTQAPNSFQIEDDFASFKARFESVTTEIEVGTMYIPEAVIFYACNTYSEEIPTHPDAPHGGYYTAMEGFEITGMAFGSRVIKADLLKEAMGSEDFDQLEAALAQEVQEVLEEAA